jgi:hypothetical protein
MVKRTPPSQKLYRRRITRIRASPTALIGYKQRFHINVINLNQRKNKLVGAPPRAAFAADQLNPGPGPDTVLLRGFFCSNDGAASLTQPKRFPFSREQSACVKELTLCTAHNVPMPLRSSSG